MYNLIFLDATRLSGGSDKAGAINHGQTAALRRDGPTLHSIN